MICLSTARSLCFAKTLVDPRVIRAALHLLQARTTSPCQSTRIFTSAMDKQLRSTPARRFDKRGDAGLIECFKNLEPTVASQRDFGVHAGMGGEIHAAR